MANKIKEIKEFFSGIISSFSSSDIKDDAASYSLNIDSSEKDGVLKGAKKEFSGPQFAQTLGSVFFDKQHYEVNFLKKSQNLRKNSIFQRFSSWLDQYI